MKIVIDIPEDDYNFIKRQVADGITNPLKICITNGTPLEQIKTEIERLHYHPKLDFIKNDEVVDMTLDIIDKYKAESEGKE